MICSVFLLSKIGTYELNSKLDELNDMFNNRTIGSFYISCPFYARQ